MRALACLLFALVASAADKWDAELVVTASGLRAGASVPVVLAARSGTADKPGMINDREAAFAILPWRWKAFSMGWNAWWNGAAVKLPQDWWIIMHNHTTIPRSAFPNARLCVNWVST